jgi:hypothetical protein
MTDMRPLTPTQIDAIKRLDKVISMRDGSADECHEYYCPYNIGCLVEHIASYDDDKRSRDHQSFPIALQLCDSCRIDDDGNIHEDDHGIYHGKPDGFDSECSRFIAIDRATGKWDCLCGLEVIANLLGVMVDELNEELRPHFGPDDEILGYNPVWRHKWE